MNNEEVIKFMSLSGNILRRTQNLFFTYKSLNNSIAHLSNNLKWYKPTLGHENKYRMKDLGGLLFQYNKSVFESMIFLIEKTIDDLFFDINDVQHEKLEFWKIYENRIYGKDVAILRNINNSIKHSNGIVENQSKSGCHLIENGFKADNKIDYHTINLEDYIYKLFVFQMDVICELFKQENKWQHKSKEDLYIMLIPDFVKEQLG